MSRYDILEKKMTRYGKILTGLLSILLVFVLAACKGNESIDKAETSENGVTTSENASSGEETTLPDLTEANADDKIDVIIGSTVLTATLCDNSSAKAFSQLLQTGDITENMHDYGDFEKVGNLPESIETNDEQITTQPGDIILYQGNQITVYYGINSWNFTRLGKIDDVTQDELKSLLGQGDVTVTFRTHSESQTNAKILVAYFSATGTTKGVAETIAAALDADIYEIVPEVPYTSDDLNYSDKSSRSSKEQEDVSTRPAISGGVENWEQYDTVLIGYPKLEYGFLCV